LSDESTVAVDRLDATDARMEQDEFQLTPAGWREIHGSRDDSAARPKRKTKSNRAVADRKSEVVEQTEEATLEVFDA